MSSLEAGAPVSGLSDRYRALLEIGRTLTGTLGRDDLYRAIYRETSKVLEVSGFYVSLYDPDRDLATIVFYADRGAEQHAEITYRGSDSEVIRTGRPSRVEDRAMTRSILIVGEEQEITRSAIAAPLRHEGRVLGAISAQSYRSHAYSPDDLELLQGIADLAAVAVENARRVEALERGRKDAERIEEVGRALSASLDPQEVLTKVIEACLELLAADSAVVWLVDGHAPVARVAASTGDPLLEVGLEWWVEGEPWGRLFSARAAVMIEDVPADPSAPGWLRPPAAWGSAVAAPLVVGGDVGGILLAGSRSVRRFGPEAAGKLQRLATQASLAVENARLHSNLQALSLTDPLTGLANRRHLQIHLDKEVAAARRGRAVVATIFDVDDFKGHNDTRGHVVGDEILRAFARILEEENRAMNLVARYGGDEFVSILSDSRMEGARLYVNRVRERVGADSVLSRYQVAVSAGLAAFEPARMTSGEDLLAAADADLYRHKAERPRGSSRRPYPG